MLLLDEAPFPVQLISQRRLESPTVSRCSCIATILTGTLFSLGITLPVL
jgi:hypothetical protein